MKLLFDLFPIILFFTVYKLYGFFPATTVAILASLIQIGLIWLKKRRIERMYLITCGLIVVLGGTSIILQNELFFQWKPTAINWLFALTFIGSHFIGNKPIIQRMMEKNVSLPKLIWKRLNISWIIFFIVMGIANIYVVYHFDMNTWVNFKLFGVLGLTLVFIVLQAIYLTRHADLEDNLKNEQDKTL